MAVLSTQLSPSPNFLGSDIQIKSWHFIDTLIYDWLSLG